MEKGSTFNNPADSTQGSKVFLTAIGRTPITLHVGFVDYANVKHIKPLLPDGDAVTQSRVAAKMPLASIIWCLYSKHNMKLH